MSTGRPILFTPERMEQIRNLVERGHTRQEIAEIVGCTVGSLQVTCSRVGLSLRRPRQLDNGVRVFAPENGSKPPLPPPAAAPPDQPKPASPVVASIELRYRDRVVGLPVTLAPDVIVQLLLEAEVRGLRLPDLIARFLTQYVKKDRLS